MAGIEPLNSAAALDALNSRARDGDARSESLLFENLLVRFRSIAKRRVQMDDVDDVIQDAIQIVHKKYRKLESHTGILIWSLTVLRNVIGNYYQAKRREGRQMSLDDQALRTEDSLASLSDKDPIGADAASNLIERIAAAIQVMSQSDQRCGKILKGILESIEEGGGQRDISKRAFETVSADLPELTRSTYYVALHRCRSRLRDLLLEMEGAPSS